jgi:hypothetical protein
MIYQAELNDLKMQLFKSTNPSSTNVINIPSNQPVDIITEYDYRNLNDPLKEPGRRPSRDVIAPLIGNPHLNIPTRGYPDSFSIQGYLVDDTATKKDDNKIIKLFGRQQFTGSSEWTYYVEIYNGGGHDKIKFELDRQRELFDEDKVYVDLIKRNYKVKLLRTKGLEYNPFLW